MSSILRRFNRLSLSMRLLTVFVVTLLIVLALNYLVIARQYESAAIDAMVQKAAAFTAAADEAQKHLSNLHTKNAFDRERARRELEAKSKNNQGFTDTLAFLTTPIVHGIHVAADAAKRENIDLKVAAPQARRPENQVDPNTFEGILLSDLTHQVEAGGDDTIHRVTSATRELHFMRSIPITESCLACHGDPAMSPTGDGKDILGFEMENLEVGDVYAAYHITMPLAPVDQQVAGFIGSGLLWTAPLVAGAIVLIVLMMRAIFSRPIAALTDRISQIANGDGDLTQRIDVQNDDELGRLSRGVNQFIGSIHDMVVQINRATIGVASASTEIAASSEQLAIGIDQQVRQVNDITATMQEMSSSIDDVSQRARDASDQANASGDAASQGGTVVRETIDGMNAIREAVDRGAESVENLGERGEQIGKIIEVINEIAEQTNLLALNAAIEAARAGEHGRGFSVVADEVRKLADRTTKATDEVAESVRAIQSETVVAVEKMKSGTARVREGVELAERAGGSLETIVTSAQSVSGMIESIAAAASQQAQAGEQISVAVTSIAEVTRQSGEGTNQAAQAATNLSQLAEQLQNMVSRFRIDDNLTSS